MILYVKQKKLACFNIIDVHCCSLVHGQEPIFGHLCYMKPSPFLGNASFHSCPFLKFNDKVVEQQQDSQKASSANGDGDGNAKVKRNNLKGKRAVVRWLEFFRFKKKKEYEMMTAEEIFLYKLLKVSCIF